VLKLQRLGFNMNKQQGRMSTGLFGLVEKAQSILRRHPSTGHAEMGSKAGPQRDLNSDDRESDLNGSSASRPNEAVANVLNGDEELLRLHGVYKAHEAEDDNGLLHLHHALAIFASRMSA
jgi:hypothetical protein